MRLTSVDLPTLGRPTTARTGTVAGRPSRSVGADPPAWRGWGDCEVMRRLPSRALNGRCADEGEGLLQYTGAAPAKSNPPRSRRSGPVRGSHAVDQRDDLLHDLLEGVRRGVDVARVHGHGQR